MRERRISAILKYVCAIVVCVWSVLPIYWVANYSFMHIWEITKIPPSFLPSVPTLANYVRLFTEGGHAFYARRGLVNSLIVSSVVTVITLLVATPAAYALGRLKFRGSGKLLYLLVGSRTLPPVSIAIPYFYFYRGLGLDGTLQGLVLIYLSITVPLMTWVLQGFFATIPIEIERAGRVDGYSRVGVILRIVTRMALPGIVATILISFLMCWNEFVYSWVFTSGTPAATIQIALSAMFFMRGDYTLIAAAQTFSLIVPIIGAFVLQRYMVRLRIVDPVTTMQ